MRRVHKTLKTEWETAMPNRDAGRLRKGRRKTALIRQNSPSQTAVPITLKDRWTIAARLAFLFAPMEEIRAVTQVPIFCPMIMGMAAP